ncbi:MAG: hypothetical protein IH989_03745 [Planctomycetes bacterium]|nr:hypothetical protein [Planctomycetota bacterium]
MAFEFFEESGRGYRPRASIRKQGQIGLNQGAVRRFDLESWKHVVLGFDRDSKRIAIRKAESEDDPGAQRVVIKDGSATISARSFLEYFDISYRDETQKYDVSVQDENNMLVIELNKDNEDGEIAGQTQGMNSA